MFSFISLTIFEDLTVHELISLIPSYDFNQKDYQGCLSKHNNIAIPVPLILTTKVTYGTVKCPYSGHAP